MKKLTLVLAMVLVSLTTFTSCEKEEIFDCATEVNIILEQYAPLLEAELPADPLTFDPLFDWQPFYDVLAQRDAAIEAIGCN